MIGVQDLFNLPKIRVGGAKISQFDGCQMDRRIISDSSASSILLSTFETKSINFGCDSWKIGNGRTQTIFVMNNNGYKATEI